MEKIQVANFEKKTNSKGKPFWVIKFTKENYPTTYDATIGEWDQQLAWFVENEVGLGGTCEVEITQKGQYTNITGINMTGNFAKGNMQPVVQSTPVMAVNDPKIDVQKSIEAQAMTKILMESVREKGIDSVEEAQRMADFIIDTFHYIKEKI